MAESVRYVCGGCGHDIEAWSDGNPYYIDEAGAKQYAYHPDHERLARCIGNDFPYLCLSCGHKFMMDSRDPLSVCPKCGDREFASTYQLDGHTCPFCKAGRFEIDPHGHCVS